MPSNAAIEPTTSQNGQPPVRRPRGRPPGNRRSVIMRAATGLFYEKGYVATSMTDIGEASGVTGAAIYRHFKSKDELLLALIEESADRSEADIRQLLEQGGSPEQMLRTLILRQTTQSVEQSQLIAIALREMRNLPRDIQAKNERRNRMNREEWVHLIALVRPDLDDAEVRTIVLGVKQLIFGMATSQTGLDPERMIKLTVALVHQAIQAKVD